MHRKKRFCLQGVVLSLSHIGSGSLDLNSTSMTVNVRVASALFLNRLRRCKLI